MFSPTSEPNKRPKTSHISQQQQHEESDEETAAKWRQRDQAITRELQTQSQKKRDECHERWKRNGGPELESAIRSGAIALLDAQWLVNFACDDNLETADNKKKASKVVLLQRRQDLPSSAFLSINQVVESTYLHYLNIICLSYMWLQPDHPDPKGTTLQLVAKWCRVYLEEYEVFDCPRYGIFWDYASLYQHPRTPTQEILFQQGLDALATFFSHPRTYCFQVTEFPVGYPSGYTLPRGANTAAYHDRGWPFVESCWMSLSKGPQMTRNLFYDALKILSISKKRAAPLSPKKMQERLQQVFFTNAKSDRPLVLKLYANEFIKRFTSIKKLKYNDLGWGDEEITMLAENVIGAGHCPCLQELYLGDNQFGPNGCAALARALRGPGLLGQLEAINLSQNPMIGDAGVEALAEILVKTPRVGLPNVSLGVNGCKALVQAAQKMNADSSKKLSKLNLCSNPNIGDDGLETLLALFLVLPSFKSIDLLECNIGDSGCHAINRAIMHQHNVRTTKRAEIGLTFNPNITQIGRNALQEVNTKTSTFHIQFHHDAH